MFKKGLISLITIGFAMSCSSSKDADKIGQAQYCLNKAVTTAEINTCLAKIDGVTSASANAVRCNGIFVREGFANPTKYSSSFSTIEGSSGANSNFLGAITFTSAGTYLTDTQNALEGFNYCYEGGGKGTTLISAYSYLAMSLYKYMVGTNLGTAVKCIATPLTSGYDVTNCITEYFTTNLLANANPIALSTSPICYMLSTTTSNATAKTFQENLGDVVNKAYNLSCSSSSANASLCASLSNAITAAGGQANTRLVAVSFITAIVGSSSIPVIPAGTCP